MDHNVETFVALSSPLNGQFGETSFIRDLFPHIPDKYALWRFFYRLAGQSVSVGNYWRDPYHMNEYGRYSDYLARLNGESYKNATIDPDWKVNFTKLKQLVTIGGPDDGIIEPWQSAHFRGYRDSDDSVMESFDQFKFYKDDVFGLKTLNEQNRWKRIVKSGIRHSQWVRNKEVILDLILPYLS